MERKTPSNVSTERRGPASPRNRRDNAADQALVQRGYHARQRVEHETRAPKKAAFFSADGAACSSKSVTYNTPEWVVDAILGALGLQAFDLDPCAPDDRGGHVRAHRKMVKADDGLTGKWGGVVYVNPPYARFITGRWVERCQQAWESGEAQLVVALLPSRTGVGWMHDGVYDGGGDSILLRGRLTFEGAQHPAPFDSVIVVWGASEETARALARAFPGAKLQLNESKEEVVA